jgi:heme/copper-type cytochrome/quinol oxidase subunit 2
MGSVLRRIAISGPVSGGVVLAMLAGCLLLWVGAPLAWLWVGSQIQDDVSLGTALMVAMVGFVATVFAIVPMLAWLNRQHIEIRDARNLPVAKHTMLEVMLVVSAFLAVVGFAIWFFGFSGASPVPLNVSY